MDDKWSMPFWGGVIPSFLSLNFEWSLTKEIGWTLEFGFSHHVIENILGLTNYLHPLIINRCECLVVPSSALVDHSYMLLNEKSISCVDFEFHWSIGEFIWWIILSSCFPAMPSIWQLYFSFLVFVENSWAEAFARAVTEDMIKVICPS